MNLIGREHQVSVLRAEIARVAQSHGGLVFVTGEAGIGKTTLVTGAVEDARRQGALVLNGSCWNSDSTPGYWPWVQVVRGLRRAVPAAEWAAVGGAAGEGLRVLLGEAVGQSSTDTFELYDAVTTALVSVSHTRPVVVVLDDLHWADPASLRLLEFAAQHTWFERLLVIGTYRDVEAEAPDHPLRPLLLPLLGRATTVSLTGLSEREVGALIRRTAGREPDADLVAEVHRHTGGNPFFVEQSARLWHSGGSATAVSPGVRDSLQRRLSMLPPPVRDLLTGAAVLGREFEREVLAATAAPGSARAEASASSTVDRLLAQAVTARLAVVQGSGRFAFAHDLVRETLYDDLAPADARRRHAEVVRAVDRTPGLADRMLPADLARHAYLAGPDLDTDRAVDILLAAAQDAGNRIAIEEEIGHLRRALERAAAVPRRSVLVGLDLGAALLMIGQVEEGWQRYVDAVAAAREVDDDLVIARVALTLTRSERERAPGGSQSMIASLIAEAYRRLVGPVPPADEAALDAAGTALASAVPNPVGFLTGSVLHLQSDQDTVARLANRLTDRFVALARANGDDDALRFGLWARHNTIWGLGTARERYEITDEIIAVSRRLNDPVTGHIATSFQWVSLLELGDPRYLERYHAFVAMAERIGMPTATFSSLVDQSIILTLLGRFDEAEKCLNEADESFSHHHMHFQYMALHLRWALLVMQGRFAETADLLVTIAASEHPCPNLLAAVVALQRGDPPPDTSTDNFHHTLDFRPLTLRVAAQAAAVSGDPERCEHAHAELLPYSGEWLVSMYGCDISGPVDLWLAVLDATLKRWEPAFERFAAALESAERLQSRPWAVEVRMRHAAALRARGGPGDEEAAATLEAAATAEAAEIGLRHVPPTAPAPVPRVATSDARFQLDGHVWNLGFAGRAVHFPDAKGLHDLHHLLGRPGEPVSAVDLLNPAGGDLVRAARSLGGDPILDDEAKARYKQRLTHLDDEIDRATLRGDTRRATTLDHERDALLTELRAAAGLAGRTRRLGDEAERARKTVTARIRDTLRKLDDQHPELAAHLRESVSTGATCVYQPATPVRWTL